MRLNFLKSRQTWIVVGIVVGAWLVWRQLRGENVLSAGHATPDDAIAWGWNVYQAGPTGWLEVSPDGKKQYLHETGWVDPYTHQ